MNKIVQRVLIIGDGISAVSAAETLRSRGFDGNITIVGEGLSPPYNRPPLTKSFRYFNDDPDDHSLDIKKGSFFEDKGIDIKSGTRITHIDTDSRVAQGRIVSTGETPSFEYDVLLFATGANPRRLSQPGSEFIWYLRTQEDCLNLSTITHAGTPITIIGGGLIGTELASLYQGAGAKVTVVEAGSRILSRVLPVELSSSIITQLLDSGVEFKTSTTLASLTKSSDSTGELTVTTTDGDSWQAASVIGCIGSVPRTELAQECGVKVDNGIVVDAFCQTSIPGIFASGDCTSFPSSYQPALVRLENVEHARLQGIAAAGGILDYLSAISRRVDNVSPAGGTDSGDLNASQESQPYNPVPWGWTKQAKLMVHAAGWPGENPEEQIRVFPKSGAELVLTIRDGLLVGAAGINCMAEVRAAQKLIELEYPIDKGQIERESGSLKDILAKAKEPVTNS